MENPANLNNALKLYDVLGKYVPQLQDIGEDYLEFIDKIIENVQASADQQAYLDAVMIMTGATSNTLLSSTPEEVLGLFMRGLIEWRIVELVQFFRDIGYQHD